MPKKTKKLLTIYSFISFFFIFFVIVFLYSHNMEFGEAIDTYPGSSSVPAPSSVFPNPCDGCGGCGANEHCSCTTCDHDHGCVCVTEGGTIVPQPGGCGPNDCGNGYCTTGCHDGITTCGACSDSDGGGGGDGCNNVAPTVDLKTPADNGLFYGDVLFSWTVSNWGTDCDNQDNYFNVFLLKKTAVSDPTNKDNYFVACNEPLGSTTPGTGDCDYPWDSDLGDSNEYLQAGNTYYWYVRADNGRVYGYSPVRSFTTGGTISGHVYQDDNFTSCGSAAQIVPSNPNWSVRCWGGSIGSTPVTAEKTAAVNTPTNLAQVTAPKVNLFKWLGKKQFVAGAIQQIQKLLSRIGFGEVLAQTPGPFSWEAEAGTIASPFHTHTSGGVTYVVQDTNNQTNPSAGGRAAYNFYLPSAGPYVVKATVNIPNDSSNSFFVNIDSEPTTSNAGGFNVNGSSWTEQTISWSNGSGNTPNNPAHTFDLTAGNHILIFRGREAGTKLDKVSLVYIGSSPSPSPSLSPSPTPTPSPSPSPSPSPTPCPNCYTCQDADGSSILEANQDYTVNASTPPGLGLAHVVGYCPSNTITLGETGSATIDIYLGTPRDPWWQALGGDIRANGGDITSMIPITATEPYLLLDLPTSQHGVAETTGSINLDPSGTIAASNPWGAEAVGASQDKSYNYAYWLSQLSGKFAASSFDGTPNEDGIFNSGSSGTLHIGGADWSGITNKIFILHNGDVSIDDNIIVNPPGSLVIVASGDISIDKDVTQVQGYYIADTINTGTTQAASGDEALEVQGGLIGLQLVNMQRDFGNKIKNGRPQNNIDPVQTFIFRPDILVNLPEGIKIASIKRWKEVAP